MQLTDKDGNVYGWNGLEITGPDGKPKIIDQGLTSVGLSMPSAFTVSNSPLTSNGTIGVTGAGTNLEYIDGTGALRTFPSLSGYITAVTASSPLSSSGGTTPNITISQASGTDNGYLSSTDWLTFNSKQPAGNYITALSGEASGSGPGTASVTLNNASVTAKVLTGVNITGGSISASDSILTAFGKLQNQINGLIGSSVYQGVWNASTNTPTLTSGVGTRGYYYIVNVAGSTNLDGITDWNVGDWAIFDGTAWQQVDNTDSVTSVNGQTGAVSLTTDNIPEGAVNQYFTQLRARQSLTLSTTGNSGAATYDNTTGVLNIPVYTDQYVGTVTSVDMSVPTGFTISGNPITSAGTLALGFNSDYSLPTIASQLEWDQAYDDMIVSASVTGTTTKTLTLNQQDGGTITASWTDYDTAPVTSVFGRTGDVVAQSGDYTTTLVPEGTNLYYTDARSRAAISSSATGLTYSSGSGVFSLTPGYSIPTTSNQSNWTTAYNRSIVSAAVTYGTNTNLVLTQQNTGTITASLVAGTATQGKFVFFNGSNLAYTSLNASAPLSFDTNSFTFSISQASGSTNGYLSSTDWNTFNNKQNAITLTTTGTSGPATLIGSILNIPQYQEVITNPVTGTGAANYVARWTSSSNISTGVLYDDGTNVSIGGTFPYEKLDIVGNIRLGNFNTPGVRYIGYANNTFANQFIAGMSIESTTVGGNYSQRLNFATHNYGIDAAVRMTITESGDIGIGTNGPAAALHINKTNGVTFGATAGNVGTLQLTTTSQGSPVSGRLLFGTDVSGWQFRIARNAGGSITDLFTIVDNGNIGIGTTTPSFKLQVEGTGFFNDYVFIANGSSLRFTSNNIYIQPETSGGFWRDLAFYTGSTEKMRITDAGSVGIGNSSPGYKLDVAGNFRATNGIVNEANHNNTRFDNILPAAANGSGAGKVQMSWWVSEPGISWNNGGFGYNVTNDGSSPYGFGRINTSFGQAYMRFDASGFLYFYNTNTSGTRFETMTLSDAGAIRFNQYGSGTKTGTRAYDLAVDSSGNLIEVPVGAGTVTGSGTANYVARWTSSSNISTGVLYDNGTNVGIGTTSPGSKLHLSGTNTFLTITDTTYSRTSAVGYLDSANLYLANDGGSNTYIGRYNNVFLAYGGGSVAVGNTNPTQLVDIGISGAQKSLRVRGTYNFDGSYLSSATSNGGAKIEFVAHTGVSTSSSYRIQHDRDQTPDLIFSYAGSAAAYSSLSYSELMRLDPNSNLGLGTSSLSVLSGYRTMTLDGSSGTFTEYRQSNVNILRIGVDGNRPFLYGETNAPMDFFTNASLRMTLAANGNLGIGTTNPTQKLSVIGNVYANGGFIGYRLDGGTGLEVNGGDMGPGTFIAKFNDYNNTSRVVINGVGDVGIGTTTPTKYMSSAETLMSIVNSNVASLYLYSTTGHLYNMSSISNGDLFWYDVSAGTERMRLTGSGNFGIGTSSPFRMLDIAGSLRVQGSTIDLDNSTNNQIWLGSNNIYFKANGDERVVITAAGNVGIGTTNPGVKLEVSGQAFVDKFQYNQGIQISGADLNGVTTAGFYAGSGMTNAPDSTGWYWVTVERHSDSGWVHQVATSYGAGNTENLMYSRVKMSGSTWTAWKKISYSTDTPTATSVYDLLPNARVDYNWVGQVVNGSWVDIFTRANNVLTSGTWMVNMYVSDYATGGEHYQYTYSGTFTWYQGGTNQNGTPAASEIALHRMGHAANSTVLYLRTTEEAAADGGNGHFQITGNYSHFANTTINFKFVKII